MNNNDLWATSFSDKFTGRKIEQVTMLSRATKVAGKTSLNDKNPFYVAPILMDFLVVTTRCPR
nr:hypothetical protein [Tanacetum cinerariifolium]